MNAAGFPTVAILFAKRNKALFGLVGVFLILISLIWLPTPLRSNFWDVVDSKFISSVPGYFRSGISANQNEKTNIIAEINSPDTRKLLSQVSGVPEWRFENLATSLDADGNFKWNRSIPAGLGPSIQLYLSARTEGHTEAYAREVLLASDKTPSGATSFLKLFRKKDDFDYKVIPESRVRNVKYDMADGVSRVSSFLVIDGELAWQYCLCYKPDGSFDVASDELYDAMEFDPKFAGLMKEAKQAVEARMKAESISGFGSCHTYWSYMEEYLSARGHKWRSPSELNPNTCYD